MEETYKHYRFEVNLLITREEYIVHHHDNGYNQIPKPILMYKEFRPKEGTEIQITSKGIMNGQLSMTTEYFDISSVTQRYWMRVTEFMSNEKDGKYKMETLYDRNHKIISQQKITDKYVEYII
jgi:hypothetical protein